MLEFIFGNHEIDRWRDDYTLAAAAALNETAVKLIASFEPDLKSATWKDGLVGQSAFIATRVTPRVQEDASPVVEHIINKANAALGRIVAHQTAWHYRPPDEVGAPEAFEGWQDVAVAAGPLAGGVAMAAALPTMAVTTSTAFFGLVTTSVVSWPVVVGGGALAGIAVATGLLNSGKIWDKTEARLRNKVRDHVVSMLLQGPPKAPAILEQLIEAFSAAAVQAKKR